MDTAASTDIKELNERIHQESAFIDLLRLETAKAIVGQKNMIDRLLLGLLTQGHILLEGVPGLAKTLAIKSLASAINAKFSRIQFTPDLLPADLIGTMIYNQKDNQFTVKKVPFSPILFWQMKLTVLRQKCKVLYWKRCRKNR